jgi:lipopolysaccharide/colanic/teichoic acid biosynthesis glycosyltransferase
LDNRIACQYFHDSLAEHGEAIRAESISHKDMSTTARGMELPVAQANDKRRANGHLSLANYGDQVPIAEPGVVYHILKRIADIAIASVGLLILFPVIAIIAAAIYLEDRAPVIYYQMRTGKGGREFRFYKFRSMVSNADALKAELTAVNEANGPIFKIKNDPRITRVGRFIRRFSLDELPQLINVLRGDMTVVGPRPLYAPEANCCTPRQWQRHSVPCGLFCLREVSGRSQLSFEQWMELDLTYVRTRSIRTDLSIFFRVLPAVFSSDGAY